MIGSADGRTVILSASTALLPNDALEYRLKQSCHDRKGFATFMGRTDTLGCPVCQSGTILPQQRRTGSACPTKIRQNWRKIEEAVAKARPAPDERLDI